EPVSQTDATGLCDQCNMVALSMGMAAAGTIMVNQLLGRPVFDNVLRNTALAGVIAYTAVVALPAVLNATASGVAGSQTIVFVGRLGAIGSPASFAAFTPGSVFLEIPDALYGLLSINPALWAAVNYGFLKW